MPVTLAIGDKIEVTCYCRLGNQYFANVLAYQIDSLVGTTTDLSAALDMEGQFAAKYLLILPQQAEWFGLRYQIISPTRRPAQFVTTNQGPGDVEADPLPTQTAAIIKVLTDKAGRSFRGRVYVPLPTEDDNDNVGEPTAAYLLRVADLQNVLFTPTSYGSGPGNTALHLPRLHSRKLGTWEAVAGTLVETTWATQRRRATRDSNDTPPT